MLIINVFGNIVAFVNLYTKHAAKHIIKYKNKVHFKIDSGPYFLT